MKTNKHIPISRKQLELIRKKGVIPPDLDDFEREAAEGWIKSSASASVMKATDRKFKSHFRWWALGSALLVLTGLGCWLLFDPNESKVEAKPVLTRVEVSDYALPDKIEQMKVIPVKKQIRAAEIRANHKEQAERDANQNPMRQLPMVDVNDLPPNEPIVATQTSPPPAPTGFRAKEIFMSDLLTIDYREYRSRPAVKTEQVLLSGTPADQEGKTKTPEETSREYIEIPYFDFLKKSMNVFAKGNYKKALFRFEEILASYPDDLNGNFYGGLCSYNLRDFERAQRYFERCINHPYSNFAQDAQWYQSKCYWESGKKEEARSLWKSISNAGGFYAAMAQRLLKENQ